MDIRLEDFNNMKILFIDFGNDANSLKNNLRIHEYLSQIDKDLISINRKFFYLLFRNLFKVHKWRLFKVLFICSSIYIITKETKNILSRDSEYYTRLRDCILDQIERENGKLCTINTSKKFIRKNFLNFIFKTFKLSLINYIIENKINKHSINTIFIPQIDGFPYYSITSLCLKKNIYIGSCTFNPDFICLIRKDMLYERIPLPDDINKLNSIKDNELDKEILKIKDTYIKHEDPIASPNTYKNNSLAIDLKYYKNLFRNNKKNGIVLLHCFTDQARVRLKNTWYSSYFDWILETIKFCKLNDNINWFFKAHPWEDKYPIDKSCRNLILEELSKNNFIYIDSKKQLLHGEVAQFNSLVVTCNGTCKIEYPALYNIPVISCSGEYIVYDPIEQPFNANSRSEYKNLILNAHNLKLKSHEIRANKELLYFLKHKPNNLDNTSKFKLYKYFDKEGKVVYRNH